MSIKSFDDAHDFYPAEAPMSVGVLGTLKLIWLAFSDGLASQHHYEDLRAQGVPHADAARKALSVIYPGR
ncbi:MAG: hypothetical protein ABL904_08540 [Hyphomicrobiaceae bacterium]